MIDNIVKLIIDNIDVLIILSSFIDFVYHALIHDICPFELHYKFSTLRQTLSNYFVCCAKYLDIFVAKLLNHELGKWEAKKTEFNLA